MRLVGSTYLNDYGILVIRVGGQRSFLDARVKTISFKYHVHIIHIDGDADGQRYGIYMGHLRDLHQTGKRRAKRCCSTTDQLDWILMPDGGHILEVAM